MKFHRPFLPAALAACLIHAAAADVVINEFMASNRSTTADEDGHYEDWIELKNTGATSVNLAGWGLTDNPSEPFKWTFPSHVLPAGGRLVVWASGKDRKGLVEQTGLLREVYHGLIGGSVESLEASGNFPDFPDETNILTDRFDVPRNIAERYGQRVSGFLVPQQSGNYEFWISGDNGSRLFLSTDDDPAKARAIAEIPADRWSDPETWNTFSTQRSASIPLQAGHRYYMVALMKEDGGGDHLTVRWRRNGSFGSTEVIPASRFIVKPSTLHTNFSISADGEPLQLTRPDGTVADEIPAVALPTGVSFGRPSSSPQTLTYFAQPTRSAENPATGASEILGGVPLFSHEAGFHENGFNLSLGTVQPGTSVIYTLDGSIPDPANMGGKTYTYKNSFPGGSLITDSYETLPVSGPIPIQDRSSQPNDLSQRTTTYGGSSWYAPTSSVFKGTVVRARLVKSGALPGPVVTQTYFVGPDAGDRYDLPVISLSINEDDLFGYERGLYTAGIDYDNWEIYNDNPNGGTPANYKRRGFLAEHPAHFEMFLPEQGRVVSQNLGFRLHGGWSRAWPQKSLRFYADRGYGEGDALDHPLIPDLAGRGTRQPVEAFKRFVLRNSGNDHERTRLRDAFMQELVSPLDIDMQGYQPAVHFINGEYWGLINIRERIDRHFIASHHHVDPDQVAILSNNAEISEGSREDRDDFLDLRSFIATNNMANAGNFSHVEERMDVDNFLRYNVAQIYLNNRDWPHNNIDTWRVSLPGGPTGAEGTADGRWRWVLFDTDFGFGLNGGASSNTLQHATRFAGADDWSTVMLRSLLANAGFRNRFINTFADHMATSFRQGRVDELADTMHAEISSEIGEHAARWRNQGSASVGPLKNFGADRPFHMRNHLMGYFNLPGVANVTLNTPDASRGSIRINSIVIDGNTPGLSNPLQPFPWSGTYFTGVPVTVEALPAPGFRFAGWQGMPNETSPVLTVMPGQAGTLTALFDEAPETQLVHYWNFNNIGDLLTPTTTLIAGASIQVTPAATSETTSGDGQDFAGENARNGDEAGAHLRLNNPIGARLDVSLPTTGFEHIVVSYETRRSGQGAGLQSISYSLDGSAFVPFTAITVTESPTVQRFDFSGVAGAADNPDFAVRIEFSQGGGGTAGNNRFDNMTLDAWPIPGANQPPVWIGTTDTLAAVEGGGGRSVDLAVLFEDADDDELTFAAEVADEDFATAAVDGSQLTLFGARRGETTVSITASDGEAGSVPVELVVLVHPSAHRLADGDLEFRSWSADEPEMAFPEHILFVQSRTDDPGAADALDRAYRVGLDTHEEDTAGFSYNNTRRTRINGLGDDGISFVNTGRGRDLGGTLLALDTRDLEAAEISFVAETLAPNEREYALRLQYRVGESGAFADVMSEGQPVVHPSTDAGPRSFAVPLPADALGQPYVQLLWRYHHVSGTLGPRAEIRLDEVVVAQPATDGFALWLDEQFPDPEDRADPAISGPAADPFGWGVGNLVRYALGIETVADLSRLPAISSDLRVRFPLDEALTGLFFVLEGSEDLDSWDHVLYDSRSPAGIEPVDGWLAVDVAESPVRFFRLRVTLAE